MRSIAPTWVVYETDGTEFDILGIFQDKDEAEGELLAWIERNGDSVIAKDETPTDEGGIFEYDFGISKAYIQAFELDKINDFTRLGLQTFKLDEIVGVNRFGRLTQK